MEDLYNPSTKFQLSAVAAADSLGIADTLTGGAIASVVDAGTTIWNSLTPASMEASTGDLLSRVSNNALQVYQEHPDAVHAASFIAGSIAPIGMALKGMNYLRSGVKGSSWFSQEVQAGSRLKEVELAYANGVGNTEKVMQMQNAFYRAKALNVVADSVAAEVAINIAMSKHVWMEDYQKDLASNFLLNVAIGSTVFGAFSHIAARLAVAKTKMAVEAPGFELIASSKVAADPAENAGENFMRRKQTIDNMQAHVDNAANPASGLELSPLVVGNLKAVIQQESARLDRDFLSIASSEIQGSSKEIQNSIRELITQPRFAELDSIGYYVPSDTAASPTGVLAGQLTRFKDFFLPPVAPAVDPTAQKIIFLPEYDSLIHQSEAPNFSSLVDIPGISVEKIKKGINPNNYFKPDVDAPVNMQILPTHDLERRQAEALFYVDNLSLKQMQKLPVTIASKDLYMLNALKAKVTKLKAEGEDVSGLQFRLTDMAPTFKVQQQQVITGGGFSPTYLKDLEALDKGRDKFHIFDSRTDKAVPGINSTATMGLSNWIGGDTESMRKVALHYLHPEIVSEKLSNAAREAFYEMKDHPNSHALRAHLQTMAVDGHVLLYRGMDRAPVGHKPIDSFSLNPRKAGVFSLGNPENNRLYKIKVDDILGSLEDTGSTMPGMSNSEILVLNRATRDNLPIAEASKFMQQLETVSNTERPAAAEVLTSVEALDSQIERVLRDQVKQMQGLGFGRETVAKRTGAPQATIDKILRNEEIHGEEMSKFTSEEGVIRALAPENKALVMESNIDKHHSAATYANLNLMNHQDLSRGLVEAFSKSSPSKFTRSIGEALNSAEAKTQLNFIGQGLGGLLPSALRSTAVTSANFTLDRLGALGPLITGFGKRVINLRNHAKETFTAPLSIKMKALAKDEAGMIEFLTAMNVGASISGKKVFKAGQWWSPQQTKTGLDTIMKADDATFLAWANSIDPRTGVPPMRAVQFKQAPYQVVTPAVIALIEELHVSGRELYHLKNTKNKVLGKGELDDIWFWSPANNPRDKEIAYAFNTETQETTMLMAKTPAQLLSYAEEYKKGLGVEANFTKIVFKGGDQADYNQLAGRHDPMYMKVADASKQHGGASASALVPTNTEVLEDLIQGYDHYINQGIDDLVKLQLNPISEHLEALSLISQRGHDPSTLGKVKQALNKPQDAGAVLGNILMGRSNLNQHEGWAAVQTGFQVAADHTLKTMADIISPLIGKSSRTAEDWTKISTEMKRRGIVHPFQVMEDFVNAQGQASVRYVPNEAQGAATYISDGIRGNESLSPRLTALSNSMAATVILRVLDAAHALVNIVGLPILTTAAMGRRMEQSFLGATKDPMAKFGVIEEMYNGIRLMNHPTASDKWRRLAEAENMLKPDWGEMNGLMRQVHSVDPGVISRIEDGLESRWVKWASKASDKSEELVREMTFFIGVNMAKKAYPGLSDSGVMTFARNFMDESVGNYTAAQRPAAFQGSIGVTMGLFQTYMVTYAQAMYRQIENKDFKVLAKMMLAQGGIFGASSLPGFSQVSEAIGTHFSDNHIDLETGTFRAVGDKTAQILLYGLPSQLVGLNTRGAVSPRIPNILGGLDNLVVVNVATQAYDAADRVVHAAFQADGNAGKAMLEALSLQSISRPLARLSELGTGRSITSTGDVIDSDTWTFQSVAARVMSTRPIQDTQIRTAKRLDSLYGAVDRDNRRKVTMQLKSNLLNGNLDQEKLGYLANQYMRSSGSATGWRSAVAEAQGQVDKPGSDLVRDELRPNSPSMYMMNDLD